MPLTPAAHKIYCYYNYKKKLKTITDKDSIIPILSAIALDAAKGNLNVTETKKLLKLTDTILNGDNSSKTQTTSKA